MNAGFDREQFALGINRRTFLGRAAYGLGGIALASLLDPKMFGSAAAAEAVKGWKGIVDPPHFPVRAKRIIHLCMAGGPSHLESLDFKPELKKIHGQPFPESFTKGQQLAQLQNTELKARGPFVEFKKHGQSGQEISDLFPKIGEIADDICIVRSMHTEQINHDPAHAFMNSGSIIKGRPSMGSWLLYGLGAETDNLPGYHRAYFSRQIRIATCFRAAMVERVSAEQIPGNPFSIARRRRALRGKSRGRLPDYTAASRGGDQSIERNFGGGAD